MLETLAWVALLLAGSGALDASRSGAAVSPQTQAAQQQKQTDAAATGAFRITGRVVNSMTNAPVAGAYVVINAASALSFSRTVRAGTDGSFVFTQIPAGRYALMARRKGYVEQMYLQHEQFTTAILVGPNLNSENLVFPLPPEGVISGEVTDEAGEPVQSARMFLFREDTEDGGHVKHLTGHQNTNEEGRYRFVSLPSGNYYLAVSAEPWYADYARNLSFRDSSASQKSGLQNSSLDLVYPITYYPNAIDVSGAASIRVETGGSAQADMRLIPVPALHLRLEMDERDSQMSRHILVSQTILGTYQDRVRVSTQESAPDLASQGAEDGDSQQRSGPFIVEVDGLRPGPSVLQVMTFDPRKARQSMRFSKSVPVDPADGQTIDVRGIAAAGVVSGIVRLEGDRISAGGRARVSEKRFEGKRFQTGRKFGREFQFFFRSGRAGSIRSVFRGAGRAGASEREREWDNPDWAKDRD